MKTLLFLLVSAWSCAAAIGNFQVLGTTSTQALISYTAPDGTACTVQVSQNPALTPLVPDVDPNIFGNANADLSRPGTVTMGRARQVVIGQRTSQYATAGTYTGVRHYSRALQAYTLHYGQLTCPSTGDTYPFTFSTGNVPLGITYGDPLLADPMDPGNQPWPESIGGLTPESFIDPYTGVYLTRLGLRSNNLGYWNNMPFGSAYNQGQFPCDVGNAWTNPCGSIVSGGSGSTTVGNSQTPLVIRPPLSGGNAWNGGYGSNNYGNMWTLDQLSVTLTGLVSSATQSNRVLDLCLSLNGGASCASSIQKLTMSQTSSSQTAGQNDTTKYGVIPWLLDTRPRLNMQESSPHSGAATVAGNTVTWASGNSFSLYWTAGGNGTIRLSTVSTADACATPPKATTSVEYTITSFLDGNRLTVSGTPPGGSVYWCASNFAVMVWRDQPPTDGSAVTLTAATMNAIESPAPTYPDNGADTACFNKQVQGGYFCIYGGLYWLNPQTGASAYYGYMNAQSNDEHGQPITNPWWTIGNIPSSESANIDQTQNVLTFYAMAADPTHATPLVVQGAFNPTTIATPATPYINGQQIGNANVVSHTPYSVTYSNGLTFTNMTPQGLSQSVVNQMAAFDPTFTASQLKGSGGWNCQPYGMSGTVFYTGCYSSYEDGPAWILAFVPGDGNPAHAGQPGGPRIVGAVSTYNTPANTPVSTGYTGMYGHGLHAIVEADNGWAQINTHFYDPVNTSNNSLPATSPDCSTFGLAGGRQCVLLNINSYTYAGVTGYEPYFSAPPAGFTGAPGETRTAQIGDTACVAASGSNCNYAGQQELLALVIKNYQGVQGAWVFQRNGYGAQKAIAAGPITLSWASIAWNLPPGSAAAGIFTVYWNPLTGCNGSPDPHGKCMITDLNETGGHGEWRNGGEAVTTNVPQWSVPILGWGSVYQTMVGAVPGLIDLAPTNVTPFVTAGVNYVNDEPPFAGVYGHPFGFDAGSHPNPPGALASPNETIRAFDNVPLQGGQNEPPWTNVSRQLYVATPTSIIDADDPFGYGSIMAMNRKLMAQGGSCGPHPLIDISGPSSSISDGASSSYTYCFARAGGECYPGSTTGQVYVNCPGITATTCQGSGIHGGAPFGAGADICIGNINNAANAIRQYTLDRTDFAGAYSRTLVTATARARMVYGFENNQLLPDNSWLLFRSEWLEFQRAEMWAAKMLPYPSPDSAARGAFTPVPVTAAPPAGIPVNNAVVVFGYQEYGGNCTTRNDPCVATGSTIPPGNSPFFFASENSTGKACASGCTITIPAISQRILYYRLEYRSANNAVLATGPLTALVVP